VCLHQLAGPVDDGLVWMSRVDSLTVYPPPAASPSPRAGLLHSKRCVVFTITVMVRACALAGGGSSNSTGPIAAGVICSVVGVAAIVAVAVVIRRRRQRGATIAKTPRGARDQERGISKGKKFIMNPLAASLSGSGAHQAAQAARLPGSVPTGEPSVESQLCKCLKLFVVAVMPVTAMRVFLCQASMFLCLQKPAASLMPTH
jgi:hypothetical protein